MIQTACAICGSYKNYSVVYKANFAEEDLNKEVFSARRLPDGSHYQIVKCRTCNLVRSNPIIESSKIWKLYGESKFTYKEEVENLEKTYLAVLQPVLNKINKNDNVLEVGCGNGFILEKLYDRGYKNSYGVEPSQDAVAKANKKIRKNIAVDILKAGIFKRRFKFIFFFQTLDHIPDPGKFLKNCYKLLEEGGYILAFNHNIDSLSAKLLGEKSPIIDIQHTFLYNHLTITKLFEKNGFGTLKVYSPTNTISLKYLMQLAPFPQIIKRKILFLKFPNVNIKLKLGNLCIIAIKKPHES